MVLHLRTRQYLRLAAAVVALQVQHPQHRAALAAAADMVAPVEVEQAVKATTVALAQTATQITVAVEAAVETRLAQMLPHP